MADNNIKVTARTVLSLADTLSSLTVETSNISFLESAAERGYLTPDEDDQVRDLFSRYLTARAALLQTIGELRPLVRDEVRQKRGAERLDKPEIFLVAYAATTLLMKMGYLLVDTFRTELFVVKKLNEAEPRFGIPRKQFTKIYRSSTSPRNVWAYLEATRFWRENQAILEEKCQSDVDFRALFNLLTSGELQIDISKRFYATHLFRYRLHSFLRRQYSGFKNVSFALFKTSGRLIAEMQLSWFPRRKRVVPRVLSRLSSLLQPGDVIVTRHDDAASNLFLPGFWPHAALYIGTESQRRELGLELDEHIAQKAVDPVAVLEARKDGVLCRPLADTLSVDACTIIRPKLSPDQIRQSLVRALSHEGKEYDFEFDFRRSDKLVCTEVVYRAYHQCGQIEFALFKRAGRVCLSAEDLLDLAAYGDQFEVVAIYGAKGNRFATEERAHKMLCASYNNLDGSYARASL